jgi:type IV pilus assembly protein PilC
MPQYSYRARNAAGKDVRGTLHAPSPERAEALLRSHQLTPIEVSSNTEGAWWQREIFSSRVRTKDLVLFSRQMSTMIRAGVPIVEALQSFTKQVQKPAFIRLIQEMVYDIQGGLSLSNSLGKHPDIFSLFYLGVVRTGEASGRLSESLEILARYLEQSYVFNRKVRSALMYPAFVLSAVVIIGAVMFMFVMPQLVALFSEANVQLPLPTRVLIAVTNFLTSYWYFVVASLVACGFLLRSYLRTPEGQYTVSSAVLHIPVFSQLFRKVYLARLTSILHTLFASDVPVIESLEIAESSIGNRVYQRILQRTVQAIKDGASVSTVWEEEPFIPPLLTTMVGVGERSGEIENAFKEANRFFQRDVDDMLDIITVFVEPILVIILGIGVGFLVAAVLLPIYNLVLVL